MFREFYVYLIISITIVSCAKNEIIPKYAEFNFNESRLNYRILYPKNFDKKKSYPLTLFLHGIGERGDDNKLQLTYVDKVFLNPKTYQNFSNEI